MHNTDILYTVCAEVLIQYIHTYVCMVVRIYCMDILYVCSLYVISSGSEYMEHTVYAYLWRYNVMLTTSVYTVPSVNESN